MSSKKKRNIFTYLSKVTLIALLIVLLVRIFFIESYSISSSQMETSLLKGDRLFVDKTAYGIRLPITLFSTPFTFDSIFGFKSYTSTVTFPYKRIFTRTVERNDVVLFNNPSEIEKPLDKRTLVLSRCVALPGDSILIKDGFYFINGKQYVFSPDMMQAYYCKSSVGNKVDTIIDKLSIPARDFHHATDTTFLLLSRYEAFLINQYMPDSIALRCYERLDNEEYRFVVPAKGLKIVVNEINMSLYKYAILLEQNDKAHIESDKLFINHKPQSDYTFEDDYFWMLSDNTSNALDSRSLGFIPFVNIIGKARLVWYSGDSGNVCWGRCFSAVK